jgi:endoglycosylceramidase
MKVVVIFVVCLYLLVPCHESADVHIVNSYIIDGIDRVRFYHGVNFVRKEFPWYPSDLIDPSFVGNLSQWGLNVVRLG